MAASTKPQSKREKSKRFERVNRKQYRWVQFTHELFGDEQFELPALGQMSNGVVERLNVGDFAPFYAWLEEAGADPDALAAMRTLDRDEFTAFQKDWGDGISIPKS